jgi:signal peptidase I
MYIYFISVLMVLAVVTGLICLIDISFFAKKRKQFGQEIPMVIGYSRSLLILALIVLASCLFIGRFGFPLFLISAIGITGMIALIDLLFFSRKRKQKGKAVPVIVDNSRAFFAILLFVFVIRSFVVQPFRVPTGSLEPTVLPNDFVVVNQFAYGLRFPILNRKIVNIGEPKRGDIVVFHYPIDPKTDYVKRMIGIPGDHIVYRNKVLTINGKKVSQRFLHRGMDFEPPDVYIPVDVKEENLDGVKHEILVRREDGDMMEVDLVVPEDQYFVMGDNRDNSADSRYWGFVPDENLVGKAFLIWFSWDSTHHWVRWSRIGTKL